MNKGLPVNVTGGSVGEAMNASLGRGQGKGKKVRKRDEEASYSALEKIAPGSARDIDRALKWVLLRLKGVGPMLLESLLREGEEENLRRETIITAVRKLEGDGYLNMPDPLHVALVTAEAQGREGFYEVRVERTYHGGATLMINDRFRARLCPEDFPANPALLRKGSRFMVKGSLYRDRKNKLCLRVEEVLP
jgi:hypothetical protein